MPTKCKVKRFVARVGEEPRAGAAVRPCARGAGQEAQAHRRRLRGRARGVTRPPYPETTISDDLEVLRQIHPADHHHHHDHTTTTTTIIITTTTMVMTFPCCPFPPQVSWDPAAHASLAQEERMLQLLAAAGTRRVLPRGALVLPESSAARRLVLIASGSVEGVVHRQERKCLLRALTAAAHAAARTRPAPKRARVFKRAGAEAGPRACAVRARASTRSAAPRATRARSVGAARVGMCRRAQLNPKPMRHRRPGLLSVIMCRL